MDRAQKKRVAVVLVGLLVAGALWWAGFVTPSYGVALTSRSMSHADVNLEGVLDPGETISVRPVFARSDVVTFAEGARTGYRFGDDWGDVLAFDARARGGPAGLGIVHRAMAWVVYNATNDAYDIPELGLSSVRWFTFPDVGVWDVWSSEYVHWPMDVQLDPEVAGRHDGWLTKGDHNNVFDQDPRGAGADGIAKGYELVEVAHTNGRVVGFVEDATATRIGVIAFGAAAVVAVVVFFFGGRLRTFLGKAKQRAGRCPGCGQAVASEPFCLGCGHTR